MLTGSPSRRRGRIACGSRSVIEADYIGRETFIRNSRAAGRPQDLADLASLEPDNRRSS